MGIDTIHAVRWQRKSKYTKWHIQGICQEIPERRAVSVSSDLQGNSVINFEDDVAPLIPGQNTACSVRIPAEYEFAALSCVTCKTCLKNIRYLRNQIARYKREVNAKP